MLFAKVSHGELAAYSYLNHKLEDLITCLQNARYLLINAANSCRDRLVLEPLNILVKETIQCESELVSLTHVTYDNPTTKPIEQQRHYFPLSRYSSLSSVTLYCEHVYVEKYMQLVSDRFITSAAKLLLKKHIYRLTSALSTINVFVSKDDE